MALTTSKDFKIAPCIAEISGCWKCPLGLNHPVCLASAVPVALDDGERAPPALVDVGVGARATVVATPVGDVCAAFMQRCSDISRLEIKSLIQLVRSSFFNLDYMDVLEGCPKVV